MSMELAYKLVKGETPWDAGKVLDDVIVLLVPTTNPDGEQMEVDWYKKYLGTKYEGGSMPWLYHYYAGHDDNRDWFMFNLAETRAVSKVLYHDWFPQIHIDEHQMGHDEARLFIPPFMNPPVPNVQPLLWRGVNLAGANMAFDLQRNGFSGVVHGRSFTGWWIGACDDTSWMHNVVGILSEMASVKLATPIYVEPTEIPKTYTQRRMEFPDPWPGGWWRLRDIVDYELTLSLSLINTASRFREEFLMNSYLMAKSADRDDGQGPALRLRHPGQAERLRRRRSRCWRYWSSGDARSSGPKRISWRMGRCTARDRMWCCWPSRTSPLSGRCWSGRNIPTCANTPAGPRCRPTTTRAGPCRCRWGLLCDQIEKPFAAKLERVEKVGYRGRGRGEGRAAGARGARRRNISCWTRGRTPPTPWSSLCSRRRRRSRGPRARSRGKGFEAPAGSFIVKNTPEVQKALPGLLDKRHATAWALDDAAGIPAAALKNPRIGLYQSWWSSMDEGWSRYVLDDLGIPYTTLHNTDFRGPKAAPDAKPAKPGAQDRPQGQIRRHRLRQRERRHHQDGQGRSRVALRPVVHSPAARLRGRAGEGGRRRRSRHSSSRAGS